MLTNPISNISFKGKTGKTFPARKIRQMLIKCKQAGLARVLDKTA